jgi:hypothetical protein
VIGEPAFASVELMRGDTEVTENALNPVRERFPIEDGVKVGVVRQDDNGARIVWCLVKSIRVTVDTDNANSWISAKERMTVASSAECRIDDPSGRGWLEPGEHLVDHHGFVIGVVV